MKTTFGLLSAVLVATTLVAQTVTNVPVPGPGETPSPGPVTSLESTNTPAAAPVKKSAAKKRAGKKPAAKKPSPELRSVPLVPGPAVVIVSNLNVRGQAKLNSEVVAHLFKDQVVTVLEEITLKHSAPDEPSAWAKITLPSETRVWVFSSFVDTNKVVKARKLNLRSGPGENYSVLGLLKHGDEVKEVTAKDDWLAIEAPANAYAFVAAQYLRQQPAEAQPPAPEVATATPTQPPPATVTEAEAPKLVPPPPVETPQPKPAETAVPPPPVVSAPPPTTTPPVAAQPAPTETVAPAAAAPEQPAAPRVVQREGIVRGTVSIQAPSQFELISPQNKKTINYLHTPSADLDLRRWKGLHVLVTGQEGLDERWPNTPVLTIEKIEVLDEP